MKEIPPLVATWVNLEDIMLNEISQTQRDKCCLISLIHKTNDFLTTRSTGLFLASVLPDF